MTGCETAYFRGYREYNEGYRADECPYDHTSEWYDSWHEGWYDAKHRDDKERTKA